MRLGLSYRRAVCSASASRRLTDERFHDPAEPRAGESNSDHTQLRDDAVLAAGE